MPARQSILLLVISLLITLPAGIASAGNDVDIQSPSSRVRVDEDGNVKINSNTPVSGTSGLIVPTSRVRNRILLRSLRYPQYSQYSQYSQCNGRSYTHQSTHTGSYGGSVNHIYSTTTTSCH
ncbi:MAG: hypothetical protein DSM106950_32685 [Stigonema ocellatum SAG 48.90 = DSM 106950]|nr:hypothetical protein [Stigonema ocellatum SAG 48.90 = DSM 106950]